MKLNCDLGEGEPAKRGRALLASVDAANIACGGHAGNAQTMEQYIRWCRELDVLIGAHPGPWSRADHGRGEIVMSGAELELLLLQQVSALEKVARASGRSLHHVKLHGALYHASERNPALARAYVRAIKRWWPRLRVIALAGGRVARAARQAKLPLWEEAFADRAYQEDGSLVSRDVAGALLTPRQAVIQARGLLEKNSVRTITGLRRTIRAQTLCVHSDTPGALPMARTLRRLLAE